MLQFLRIENLALMDLARLEFDEGFTAITGETGAGKSVLLGALSLLAGNRADKTLIRKGADTCTVEALLQIPAGAPLHSTLEALGAPPCDAEGALVLRRVLSRTKASRVEINGSVQTLANLQTLAEDWIDFHGPGEPQKLFHEKNQLGMLDLYAGHADALATYREGYAAWRGKLAEAERMEGAERLSDDERDFLQGQVDKIDRLELTEESLAELERDFNRLSSAKEIRDLAGQLREALGEDGMAGQGAEAARLAHALAQLDTSAAELARRLDSALLELDDLSCEFTSLAEDADLDEDAAEALQNRMQAWLEVKRKYGSSLDQVQAKRNEIADRIASQGDIEGRVAQLRKEAAAIEKDLKTQAKALTNQRQKAAEKLAKKASSLLGRLGFKKAELQIEVMPEQNLTSHGDSTCQILFRANAGQDLLPLNKIASSGETARVMLALKTALAEADATPVLVFDEVDANVGGEAGAEVGRELARLAAGHQVFCVTHLPQVAAQAAQHFVVEKSQSATETTVKISPIHDNQEARLDELARMLGDRKSKSARTHAQELLAG